MLGAVTQRSAGFFADFLSQPSPVDVFADVFSDIAGRRALTRVDKLGLEARPCIGAQLLAVFTDGKLTQQRGDGTAVFLRMKHRRCQ